MLIEERSRDIGQFMVGRLLPFRKKRQVGPFTFIDHMGPAVIKEGHYMDVDQHPHIGLSTLTYLLDGEIEHKDSTGAVQVIRAGDIGFMTSGRGVTHTERTPTSQRDGGTYAMHGYQVWVAMPKGLEELPPSFQYISRDELPHCREQGMDIIMLAGKGFGMESPLKVHSPLFMVDISTSESRNLDIRGQLEGEIGVVVVEGSVISGDQTVAAGQMLISKTEHECRLRLADGTRLLLFGGKAFPEERYMYWNFVSSDKERIEKAKIDWREGAFPKVAGDQTYIPLP